MVYITIALISGLIASVVWCLWALVRAGVAKRNREQQKAEDDRQMEAVSRMGRR